MPAVCCCLVTGRVCTCFSLYVGSSPHLFETKNLFCLLYSIPVYTMPALLHCCISLKLLYFTLVIQVMNFILFLLSFSVFVHLLLCNLCISCFLFFNTHSLSLFFKLTMQVRCYANKVNKAIIRARALWNGAKALLYLYCLLLLFRCRIFIFWIIWIL